MTETHEKKALRLAGLMADAAIRLSGGDGLNGRYPSANLMNATMLADTLRERVEAYNAHIIAWSQAEKV